MQIVAVARLSDGRREDRSREGGLVGRHVAQVVRSVVAATSSSRFVVPNYWPDPKTGIGYQVQVEIPQPAMTSLDDLGTVPVLHKTNGEPVAAPRRGGDHVRARCRDNSIATT